MNDVAQFFDIVQQVTKTYSSNTRDMTLGAVISATGVFLVGRRDNSWFPIAGFLLVILGAVIFVNDSLKNPQQ